MSGTAAPIVVLLLCLGKMGLGGEVEEEETNRFNTFDWGLTKAIENSYSTNVVISPISVKLALATLYEGAKGNTSRQLEKALNLQQAQRIYTTAKFASIVRSLQTPGDGYALHIGTKVFTDKKTNPKAGFKEKIKFLYDASIDTVDFSKPPDAAKKINTWVKEATQGHITDLVSESDSMERTLMLLINAIYFKGRWEFPFPAKDTQLGTFYVSQNKKVEAPFMKAVNTLKFYRSSDLKASVVRLPYAGDKFAMFVVLPERVDGLKDVMKAVNPALLKALLPKMEEITVKLLLPKFAFEFTASLAQALQEMGLTDMFSSNANLTGVADSPDENLYVSNILQKAGLIVNEIGTEAYAATEIELASKFGEEVAEFVANRPFLFFIEEELTRTIVFVGKVVDPSLGIGHSRPQVSQEKPSSGARPVSEAGGTENATEAEVEGTTGSDETDIVDRIGGGPESTSDRFKYFDIDLIRRLHDETKDNFVVSTASIKIILGLITEGSEGKSASEILSLLRLPSNKANALQRLHMFNKQVENPNAGVKVKSGNRILVSKDLKLNPSYQESVAEKYSAQIASTDFKSPDMTAKSINDWVNTLTQGFIPMLVSPASLDPHSLVVLVNAMYFQGEWRTKFDPKETIVDCFYTAPTNCIKTNMMITGEKFKYGFVSGLNARVLELPYKDQRYSMVLVLPEERGGLRGVVRDLPYNQIIKTVEELPVEEVIVQIPKFTIEYEVQLPPILEKAGVKAIFSDKADLSGMLGKTGGRISNILHKAKIVVDEKGTTAGAGTSAVIVPLMVPKGGEFIANRPFLFFIKDTVSGLLFGGQFVRPTEVHGGGGGQAGSENNQPTEEEPQEGSVGSHGQTPRRPQVESRPYPPRPTGNRRPQGGQHTTKDSIQFPG